MLTDLNRKPRQPSARSTALSVVAHAVIIGISVVAIHRAPRVALFRLPGTAHGLTLLTYYNPGSRTPSASDASVHSKRTHADKSVRRKVENEPQSPAPPHADAGSGSSPESGLGEGDIRIALLQHFSPPHPDLSGLAPGTKGDVILDAVIDEYGRVEQLTLLKGLSPSIDQFVIATVKQWLFTPATKDGVPVASEQEFHFHYERS